MSPITLDPTQVPMEDLSTSSTLKSPMEDLSPSEQQALGDLRDLCQQHNVFWPSSDTYGLSEKPSNDDNILLRYLRARNFDPEAAFKQFATSEKWRRKMKIDNTYDNVDEENFEALRRLQPQWTGRTDSEGVPIMVYVVAEVRAEDIAAMCKSDPKMATIFLPAEYVTQFVQPFCSHLHGAHIDTSVNIIDLSHVGVSIFWNLRKLLSTASEMATAHYPESVKRIYVVGAPSFFPTIWRFITAWFEPNTTRKITILSEKEVTPTLIEGLGKENVPVRFGGSLEYEFGGFPCLDEKAKSFVKTADGTWPQGPLRFMSNENTDQVMALGSKDGKARRAML